MTLFEKKLNERLADNLYCPDCGHDVQPDDCISEVAESIGEVYLHPYCPECHHYKDHYDLRKTEWYQPDK